MKRILFFIENLTGGGAEKVLRNLVNAMDLSCFDVTVQTLWKSEATGVLKEGIHYRYCYGAHGKVGQLRSRLEAALGLTYPLHIKSDYDIEVAYLEYGSTKIMARSTNSHARKVAWVHSDLERKINGNDETSKKVAAQYAAYNKIVCVSETARNSFVRLFGREKDVLVLHNTIDDAEIRRKAALPHPDLPLKNRLTVAAVGRLSPEKRYDMLLDTHKALLREGIAHDLWIVGDGPQRDRLEAQILRDGLADSVSLVGFQSNPYPFMAQADVLVCSSVYEGLSTFITEGVILGKPIVTTDCGGMAEILGEPPCGLITANDSEAFTAGLRKMLTSALLRINFAEQAARRAQKLNAAEVTQTTEQFFYKLLEDGQST